MQLVELFEQYILFYCVFAKRIYPHSMLSKRSGGDMEEKCRKLTKGTSTDAPSCADPVIWMQD